jgi:4-hydroxy-tetrahydrodipicolinate synthase
MFEGLLGFPITPMYNNEIDFDVLKRLIHDIDNSNLDGIGVLGSTGSFAYLNETQRCRVMECWSEAKTPWIAGISATTAEQAIRFSKLAKLNGAKGAIVSVMAYAPLNQAELTRYFLQIADRSPLPLCIYNNPVTTGYDLELPLLTRLSNHANVKSAKIFAKPDNKEQHKALSNLDWKAGYAVDAFCCEAMINGASAWYSTLAGTAPELLVPIAKAIKLQNYEQARQLNAQLHEVFRLMKQHSGYKLVHAIAQYKGWRCELPSPLIQPEIDLNAIKQLIKSPKLG